MPAPSFTLSNPPYTLQGEPSNNNGGVSFVVDVDRLRVAGQENGKYGISFSSMPGEEEVVLDYFQIRPACRLQGHGRKILTFLAAWFQKGGTRRIRVTNETAEGKQFYRKLGFRSVCGLGLLLDLRALGAEDRF